MTPSSGRTISVVDHDPRWAARFGDERERILRSAEEAGVSNEIVSIEHVGSTAVPGLAAKPVVDMMVGLGTWPASEAFVGALERLDYVHHGEAGMVGRHYFTDAPLGQPRTRHIHAVAHGSWFWREHLRFRDRLRAHPEEMALYAEAKRTLARQHRHDSFAYTEGKTETVRSILRRAREEEREEAIHAAAATGYHTAAGTYDQARPSYPEPAVVQLREQLGIQPGSFVVDVGAGTGKLSQLLTSSQMRVTAVEPVAKMREVLRRSVPAATTVDGTAEELPLASGSVGAIVVGQAFHWFDPAAALSEFLRVLDDEGGVALLWNVRDTSVDWMDKWARILEPIAESTPRQSHAKWRDIVEATQLFADPQTAVFANPHVVPRDLVIERVASTSFVAALDHDRRGEVLGEFRHMLDTHPQTRDRDEITVPYRTELHILSPVR